MRWLAACLVVVGSPAAAFVLETPPVIDACGREPTSWNAMATCLGKLGDFQVIRQDGDAKLVRLVQRKQGNIPPRDLGVYLLLQRDHKWRIGGMYEPGEDYEILDLRQVTINDHTGWRIDLGRDLQLDVQLDDATSQRALLVHKVAVFCPGDGYRCYDAVTACDVLVHGKAYWTFRGKLAIEGTSLKITGDRSNGGSMCAVAERVQLGWPSK